MRRYLTDKLTMDLRSALCPNVESANAEREDAVVVRKVGCVEHLSLYGATSHHNRMRCGYIDDTEPS